MYHLLAMSAVCWLWGGHFFQALDPIPTHGGRQYRVCHRKLNDANDTRLHVVIRVVHYIERCGIFSM